MVDYTDEMGLMGDKGLSVYLGSVSNRIFIFFNIGLNKIVWGPLLSPVSLKYYSRVRNLLNQSNGTKRKYFNPWMDKQVFFLCYKKKQVFFFSYRLFSFLICLHRG